MKTKKKRNFWQIPVYAVLIFWALTNGDSCGDASGRNGGICTYQIPF